MAVERTEALQREDLKELMEGKGSESFYIVFPTVEYRALFNHTACGSISLYRLGASRRKLEDFQRTYMKRLRTKDHWLQSSEECENLLSIPDLRGEEEGFYRLVHHYELVLEQTDGGLDALVREQFPALMAGMMGSALHGLIHLGYGFSERIPSVVCEGLAYLHYCYNPLVLSESAPLLKDLGTGKMEILDVFGLIRQDHQLRDEILKNEVKEEEKRRTVGKTITYFEHRADPILREMGDILADYVHLIKFPHFYESREKSEGQKQALLKWLIDCCFIVYLSSERPNDFFLLHGITSSWSLRELLSVIQDYDIFLEAFREQLCILMATYLTQLCPYLDRQRLKQPDTIGQSMEELKARALALPADTDEHVYKVVQVAAEMSLENNDSEVEDIYKRAAVTAMAAPLAHCES